MNAITKTEIGGEAAVQHWAASGVPGIYDGISNDAYHSGPGVSKSGLWTIYTKTPAHYKFPPDADDEELTTQQIATRDFGTAIHTAILEPELFEGSVFKGPKDRRGNNWKDAMAEAANTGKVCLVAKAYDRVLAVRDAMHANPRLNAIITGGQPKVEASAYWTDPATGQLCRCRPDLYRPDLKLMLDLKSCESAHPEAFARAVTNYGYHSQEAWYSDGMNSIGSEVEAVVFLAWEKKSPYAFALYELPPSIVDDGRMIMRKALETYDACQRANSWPAYGDEVKDLSFRHWAYRETEAPRDGEVE